MGVLHFNGSLELFGLVERGIPWRGVLSCSSVLWCDS